MASAEAPSHADLESAAKRLSDALRGRGWMLATAESCTGGLVGHAVTQVPGSSAHYLGGLVTYSNTAKQDLLGVPAELLDRVGAVSAEVAVAMAHGTLERFPSAHLAVSVTGIAGPDGGSVEKPVGLTYVGTAVRDGSTAVERHVWPHDRDGNKRASALACIAVAAQLASDV